MRLENLGIRFANMKPMLIDTFGRKIDYLRISVTDRCNLRCSYCMPPDGIVSIPHEKVLSFEQICDFVRVAVELGVRKVRLTGGEPLVRRGIVRLVEMLAQIDGIEDFAMTTNGQLLANFAQDLAKAGLMRVNVSLDTIDSARYAELTRGGDINNVFTGLSAANDAGLHPIKLNCVIENSAAEPDALAVATFAREHNFFVRFILRMDLETGRFGIVSDGTGGNCKVCNRLRLSSDGFVLPCLFSDTTFDVRELGAREAILAAVQAKREHGGCARRVKFYSIGG